MEIGRYELAEGDILINRVNSLSHVGKWVLVPRLAEPALYESNMMRLRMRTDVDREFVAVVLGAPSTRRHLVARAKKAVQQVSVNQDDVSDIPLPLPSRAEQERVAAVSIAFRERLAVEHSQLESLATIAIGRERCALDGAHEGEDGRSSVKFCYVDETGLLKNEPCVVMAGIIVDAQRHQRTRDEFHGGLFDDVKEYFSPDRGEMKATKLILRPRPLEGRSSRDPTRARAKAVRLGG